MNLVNKHIKITKCIAPSLDLEIRNSIQIFNIFRKVRNLYLDCKSLIILKTSVSSCIYISLKKYNTYHIFLLFLAVLSTIKNLSV